MNGAQLAGSWAVRETFVALVTTNLPMIYPLFSALVGRHISSWVSTMRSKKRLDDNETPSELVTIGHGGHNAKNMRVGSNPLTNVTFSESEERMVGVVEVHDTKSEASSAMNGHQGHGQGNNIQKDVEVAVVCQERGGQYEKEDLQRQQAIASIEETSKPHQGHFAFARGPAKS